MKLSIIVVSWNTSELLKACLESVRLNLSGKTAYEVIVVDNASNDGSAKMVEMLFPGVRLIKNTKNRGFGEAVNQAAKISSGDFILLLNSDAQLLDDGLETDLLPFISQDPTIGVITGKMVDPSNKPAPCYFAFPKFWNLVKAYTLDLLCKIGQDVRGRSINYYLQWEGKKIWEVDWVSGGYLMLRRCLLKDDEIFDQRLFMYFEDVLLCRKVQELGYKTVYMETAPVMHIHGGSAKKIKKETTCFSFESSRIYILEIYSDAILRLYDLMLRSIWYIFCISFSLASLGVIPRLKEKANLFFYLLKKEKLN